MPQQRYEQVAGDLRGKIQSGEYPPGTKLPSRTELMKIYKVSDTVIGRAMILLRLEGLVEGLQGVGVIVKEPE